MADYLKYDTEQLSETKRVYNECAADMETLKGRMDKMVESVKDGWKSDAGTAFFNKYNDEWLKGFKQYKEVLEHMAENLDSAKGKYSEVTRQAKTLKIK